MSIKNTYGTLSDDPDCRDVNKLCWIEAAEARTISAAIKTARQEFDLDNHPRHVAFIRAERGVWMRVTADQSEPTTERCKPTDEGAAEYWELEVTYGDLR